MNFWVTYAEYVVQASRMNISHFPVALFASFFVLAVTAALLRRYGTRFQLTASDLAVVLAMGMVGAMVPTSGLMGFFLGVIATPFYFATPENGWAEYFHPHIVDWLAPRDEGQALTWFFDGPPDKAAIPWRVWLTPIAWWLVLIAAIVYVSLAVAVILRRPWSEHERLVYPLVSVADELMEEPEQGQLPEFLRSGLFWAGLVIPLGILGWNILSFFWTLVPSINIAAVG